MIETIEISKGLIFIMAALDVIAIAAIILTIIAFVYVRNGGEIVFHYTEEEDDDSTENNE